MGFRVLITILFLLLVICCSSALSAGASGNVEPPLPDFLQTYNEVRSCFSLLFGALGAHRDIRLKYEPVLNLLDQTCTKLEGQSKSWNFASKFFNAIKRIPLGQLPHVANVIGVGAKNLKNLIKNPEANVCATVKDIRNKLKIYDASVKAKVLDKLSPVNAAANKIDTVLTAYKSVYEKYKIIKDRKAEVCPSIVTTFKNLQEWRNNCKKVLEPIQKLNQDLSKAAIRLQNTIRNPVLSLISIVKTKLEVPPLNSVQELLANLRKVIIPLPQVQSKRRGTGVIPSCCPANWKNTAGLCYENCPSGFQTVALTCMEYCRAGYRVIGALCSRFWWERHSRRVGFFTVHYRVPRTHTYVRATRARFGRAPATFGHSACACRPRGKGSFEGGLCYHKCGAGAFAGFPKSVLDACWQTGVKNYKLEELLSILNIFEQIKKVPGVGHVMDAANKIIDKPLEPILSALNTMFNRLNIPNLRMKFNINVPIPSILPTYVDKILLGISKIPLVQFKRNGLCVDVTI